MLTFFLPITEILSYSFFQNALIAGIIISIISGVLGSLIVLRKEVNVTHSIAHVVFLGIVISFFFGKNYFLFGAIFSIFGALFLFLLEKTSQVSRESTKEILAQTGLAGGIFLIGFLGNLQIDIFNFLFGNILFITLQDIIFLLYWGVLGGILYFLWGKAFLRGILAPDIAHARGDYTWLIELIFLIYLSIFIASTLKMFGVFLLASFLVLPGNIAKLLASSFSGVFYIATEVSLLCVIFGLFFSYYWDTNAGATIVLFLIGIFFISLVLKSKK